MKQPCPRPFRFNLLNSLVTSLALVGCGAEFDPGTQVSSLRVLAVQADSPFASPGQTVRLSTLSHDPQARPISWAWAVCQNPASSSVEACLANIIEDAAQGMSPLLASGEGVDNVEVSIPTDALDRLPPQARQQALIGVLSVACPGDLDLNLDPGSSNNALPIRCTDSATGEELGLHDYVVGVKRVFVREAEQNGNPVIGSVLFDGEEWPFDEVKEVDACDTEAFTYDDCKNQDPHSIAALVSPASYESGQDEFGRTFTEQVIVQHYTTDGIFKDEIRIAAEPETRWVARSSGSGSEQSLWFVARDDRGGVSWTERRVRVR